MNERRKRGRPKDTAKFATSDEAMLSTFAEELILGTYAKLAPFLRDNGFAHKDIRRAQKHWRRHKHHLLERARLQNEAAEPPSVMQAIAHVVEVLRELKGSATTGLTQIANSFERERERHRRLALAGKGPRAPIDLENQAETAAAIERYEAKINEPKIELETLGFSGLSLHLKLFIAAHMLHEMSIVLAEQEARKPVADDQDG